MPTDRVLIEIVTAANMAGVEQAKAGLLGLTPATIALTAAVGGLILVGKSAVENTEAQRKAHLSLKQATDVSKLSFNDLQKSFDDWAETNKRYIPDQYAAETALAAFVRAGANAKDSIRELNDALDLSTLRGIDMEDAQKNITLALTGSSKALKVLGITTGEYNAIMHDKTLTNEQKHLALLALIEAHTKDGRKAQTELSKSQQALNKDWQDFSQKIGPPVTAALDDIILAADIGIQILDELWQIIAAIIASPGKLGQALNIIGQDIGGGANSTNRKAHQVGRAGGGLVLPYSAYTVGEHGPETLYMGGSGGYVSPRGGPSGGATVNVHIGTMIGDGPSIDRFANEIARRLSYATGR